MDTASETRVDESRYLTFARARLHRLLSARSVLTAVQPMVDLETSDLVGHELLARPRTAATSQTARSLLQIAESQGLAAELSRQLRINGLAQTAHRIVPGRLFLNTHPAELERPRRLIDSLRSLASQYPEVELVVELPERAELDLEVYVDLRACLQELGIDLAFDEFGTGRSRLLEMAEAPPRYVKFSRHMVRGIDGRAGFRQRVLRRVLEFTLSVGALPIAVGIETASELAACRDLGFTWAQGFFLGRPWTVAA